MMQADSIIMSGSSYLSQSRVCAEDDTQWGDENEDFEFMSSSNVSTHSDIN